MVLLITYVNQLRFFHLIKLKAVTGMSDNDLLALVSKLEETPFGEVI
jgi:hypothetical protein